MLFDESIQMFVKDYHLFSAADFRLPIIRYAGKRKAIMHAAKLPLLNNHLARGA